MDGILLVDKPRGWTSFDAVAKVRGVLRASGVAKAKVGHTGTLDPLATGLLVLLLGKATKQAPELSKVDKVYKAELQLGYTSATGDAEGVITPLKSQNSARPLLSIRLKDIKEVLETFIGEIEQVPPAFSAIKVDGQRAYKLARQGKEVKIEPRKVTIYSITDVKVIPPIVQKSTIVGKSTMPKLSFKVKVSSGTYIRTLAEDIGKALGTGAYLTNLKRTQVGRFNLKDAIKLESKYLENLQNYLKT
ncbi:MAG: tRNA pseudouridine(55) synthase TruB [Candidatus Saccharimonadales bacterium]